MGAISERTIARLSLYRRILDRCQDRGELTIYSHELARQSGSTPAQVRRDLMEVDYFGSASRGYRVDELIMAIDRTLDGPRRQLIGLVGVGNLGRAVLHYFAGRRRQLEIVAAFDKDPAKIDRMIYGIPVYNVEQLPEIAQSKGICLGVITVSASGAQDVADLLVKSGVRGILNFAPVPLHTPTNVYVEEFDMTTAMEKVAYFARMGASPIEEGK